MKLALQIVSWVGVILGVFAILGGVTTVNEYDVVTVDWYAVFGGFLFFLQGVLALAYINLKD